MSGYALCVCVAGKQGKENVGWYADQSAFSDVDKPELHWGKTLWYNRKSDGLTCLRGRIFNNISSARSVVEDAIRLAEKDRHYKPIAEIWLLDHHGNPCEKMPIRKPHKRELKGETTTQVIDDLANLVGYTGKGRANFALFADDAAKFIERLRSSYARDLEKYRAIRNIVMGKKGGAK